MFDKQPLNETLSGLALEYRIVELYSRDAGKREAKLAFDVGQGTQDLGFRNEVNVLFDCEPAVEVTLDVHRRRRQADHGAVRRSATRRAASIPSLRRRLAPDFFFHDQIYRHSGEIVLLPPGKYDGDVHARAGVPHPERATIDRARTPRRTRSRSS